MDMRCSHSSIKLAFTLVVAGALPSACGPGEGLPLRPVDTPSGITPSAGFIERPCDERSCPDGCCDGNVCTPRGDQQTACGAHGRACVNCVGNPRGSACVLTPNGDDRVCACRGPISPDPSPDCVDSIHGFACVFDIDSDSGLGCGCLRQQHCPPLDGVPRSCDIVENVCVTRGCLLGTNTPCNGGCCTLDHVCVSGTTDQACGDTGYCQVCAGSTSHCLDRFCS